MQTTHAAPPRSTDRAHWAIENTTKAQQRLGVYMRDHAPRNTRLTWQAVASAMILVGDDETGCLRRPLAVVMEYSGASQSAVETSIRGLVRLGILRREPTVPGSAPIYRWLRPIADRIYRASLAISRGFPGRDESTHLRTPIWLRGPIPAAASDLPEPTSSVQVRDPLEPIAAPAAALWSQIEAHDVRAMWLEVYSGWRARTLQIHAPPRDPKPETWRALAVYAQLFGGTEQRRALELTCQAWPEVASDTCKSRGYPLAWLEHDLEALEPRVRRALALASQRSAERTTTVTGSPVSPEERRQLARVALVAVGGGRAA